MTISMKPKSALRLFPLLLKLKRQSISQWFSEVFYFSKGFGFSLHAHSSKSHVDVFRLVDAIHVPLFHGQDCYREKSLNIDGMVERMAGYCTDEEPINLLELDHDESPMKHGERYEFSPQYPLLHNCEVYFLRPLRLSISNMFLFFGLSAKNAWQATGLLSAWAYS